MKTAVRIMVLLVAANLWSAQERPSERPQSPPKVWKLKYAAGPLGGRSAPDVKLSFDGRQMTFDHPQERWSIPVNSIVTVIHSTTEFRRSEQVGRVYFAGGASCASCGSSPGYGGYVFLGLVAMAIAHPMKGDRHLIEIVWEKQGTEQDILLEATKNDYLPLLNSLQQETGIQWRDVDSEKERILARFRHDRDRAIPLTLQRAVKAERAELAPGPYVGMLLERTPAAGELYLFSGSTMVPENLSAILTVEIAAQTEKLDTARIETAEAQGDVSISAIQTASQILRVRPRPPGAP